MSDNDILDFLSWMGKNKPGIISTQRLPSGRVVYGPLFRDPKTLLNEFRESQPERETCPHCKQSVAPLDEDTVLKLVGDSIPLSTFMDIPVGMVSDKSRLVLHMIDAGVLHLDDERMLRSTNKESAHGV